MGAATGRARAGSLRLRVLSAAVGLPLVVGAVWLGGPVLFLLGLAVALAGLWEFRNLTARIGTLSLTVAGAGTVGFMVTAWRGEPLAPVVVLAVVAGGLLWHLGRQLVKPETNSGLASWALTVAGALYVGALLSFGLALHRLEYSILDPASLQGPQVVSVPSFGRDWLLLVVLVTFASDTGAYFVGRIVGRHRLAPRISPGKTWEGAIGGLVISALATLGLVIILAVPLPLLIYGPGELPYRSVRLLGIEFPLSTLVAVAIGIGVSLLAQAGDLAESFLKRAGGVKEAGWLVPGHGGILDRLDSVVLVLPAAYYGLVWLT